MSGPKLRLSMAPTSIPNMVKDSDSDLQEIGLRNAAELATAEEGLFFLKALHLNPHFVNLVDSDHPQVSLLANWVIANMSSGDKDAAEEFIECGLCEKWMSQWSTFSSDALDKILSAITNIAQFSHLADEIISKGMIGYLLKLIEGSEDPKQIISVLFPIITLLKYPKVMNHESFVSHGGISILIKLLAKLGGDMTGQLKSQDYELLRHLLMLLFIISWESSISRMEIINQGFLSIVCSLSNMILPPDIGSHSVLLQLVTNLSCLEQAEIPILESGFLLSAVDHMGSVSDELRCRAFMLIANMASNEQVRNDIKHFGWDSHILHALKSSQLDIQQHALRLLINISANGACRKLLIDAGISSYLASLTPIQISKSPHLQEMAHLAISNLEVPIEVNVADEFKVEVAEILIDEISEQPISSTSSDNIESHTNNPIGLDENNNIRRSPSKVTSHRSSQSWTIYTPSSGSTSSPTSQFSNNINPQSNFENHNPKTFSNNSQTSEQKLSVASGSISEQTSKRSQSTSNKVPPITQTSQQQQPIEDPFLTLDKEFGTLFGKSSIQDSSLTSPRGRRATMIKDPKDEPLYIRRERIAKEVLETEEKYVINLKRLIDVFLKPLQAAVQDGHPILTQEEINLVFSVVEPIYQLHQAFLHKLRPVLEKWTWSSCIGTLFENLADRLKVYEPFVNNYERAENFLISPSLAKRKVFTKFMQDAIKEAKEAGYAGISHFLIMPIQRPLRFLMLLGELVKYTPPQHLDMPHLTRSVARMSTLTSYLNEARRVSESLEKIEELLVRFGGQPSNETETFDLKSTGRIFIKEAYFTEDRTQLVISSSASSKSGSKDSLASGGNKRDSLQSLASAIFSSSTNRSTIESTEVTGGHLERSSSHGNITLSNNHSNLSSSTSVSSSNDAIQNQSNSSAPNSNNNSSDSIQTPSTYSANSAPTIATGATRKTFVIWLPNGLKHSSIYNGDLPIRFYLERLCKTRDELTPNTFIAKDASGKVLDIETLASKLDSPEIFWNVLNAGYKLPAEFAVVVNTNHSSTGSSSSSGGSNHQASNPINISNSNSNSIGNNHNNSNIINSASPLSSPFSGSLSSLPISGSPNSNTSPVGSLSSVPSSKDLKSKIKKSQRYVLVFLFNDSLIIATMVKKFLRQSSFNSKLQLERVIYFDTVESVDSNPIGVVHQAMNSGSNGKEGNPAILNSGLGAPKQFKFALNFKNDPFPLVLMAQSDVEKNEWVNAIKTAIQASRSKEEVSSQISEIDKLMGLL